MDMNFVVRTHLLQKRFEAWLAVLLPLFLILESGIANAWVYAGGVFNFSDSRTWLAFGRGLFFEVLTFSCFTLARILVPQKTKQARVGLMIVGFVGVWCIIVSAGNNLGWVLSGGEMAGILAAVGRSMPGWFYQVYQVGLALLLPIAVGGIALVNIEQLVHHTIDTTIDLDTRLLQLEESTMHKTIYKASQKGQEKEIKQEYDGLAANRTRAMIARVKGGDMTFGAKASASAASPGLRRVDAPGLPPGAAFPQLAPPPGAPAIAGQFVPASAVPTGDTQNIVFPTPQASPFGVRRSGIK